MVFISDEQYNQILELLPICCVDVAILHNSELLVIKRGENETYGGMWWIPGGRVLKGECWHTAVKRKALSETGLDVEVVRKIQSYEEPEASGKHFVTTLFVTSVKGEPNVKLDNTSSDYKWVDQMDNTWHPMLKEMIRDAEVFKCPKF